MKPKIIIFLVFILAFSLRLYGLNWDQNQHLHPDERFLTMVVNDLKLPVSLSQYFSTATSPFNPYNYPQYQFFVYGTLPLFITKVIAVIFHLDTYDHIVLLGRFLSAAFDSVNIILLYYLSRKKVWPSLFYALTILPIQLAHFFTVDTFLSTLLLATFTLLSYNLFWAAAITFALALSCKIYAILFIPIFGLFILRQKKASSILSLSFIVLLLSFITFRFFSPYTFTGLFSLNPDFISSLKTLASFSDPHGWFPPSIQWLSKTPILFSLQNIVFFGLGLSLTIVFLISLFKTKKDYLFWFSLVWILLIVVIEGSQQAQTMRYFLPIYPFIILIAFSNSSKLFKPVLILQFLIVISFLTIYSVPHSRVQATNWIYKNIPLNSTISSEYWDDALPLGYSPYQSLSLPFYDPDTPEKWQKLNQQLNQVDYLIMSSNRLWGSIPLVPERYPQTSKFYQDLFANNLNFEKLVEINSYPGFRLPIKNCYYLGPTNMPGDNSWLAINQCGFPGIYFRDDTAEEAFTVYDHPKVLIFKSDNINQ